MNYFKQIEAAFQSVGLPTPMSGEEMESAFLKLAAGIEKLVAVAEAARASPIREGWNEDRCSTPMYNRLREAQSTLEMALAALESEA